MAKNEVVMIPVNCNRTHKTFYARYDNAYDGVWVLTYGLKYVPEDAHDVSKNGMSTIDISHSRTGPQYKCPHCGNRDFVKCGRCGKLTCYDDSGTFTCDHCGRSGKVSGYIKSLEGSSKHSQ